MAKGPAPKGEYAGKSSVFSTRIRPDLRKALEKAARHSGRSLSQEVEHRLRRSFTDDDRIEDGFGDRQTYRLMRMMADAIHLLQARGDKHWLEDPAAFRIAKGVISGILERVAPKDDTTSKIPPDLAERSAAAVGEMLAAMAWIGVHAADVALPLSKGSTDEHRRAAAKSDLQELLLRTLQAEHDDRLKARLREMKNAVDEAEAHETK